MGGGAAGVLLTGVLLTSPQQVMGGGAAYSVLEVIFGPCHCTGTFECSTDIDANGGIFIWVVVALYMFKALGTVCDEYFVPSLEEISQALKLSNDVAGATFMAAGSSAPELFTSLVATFLIVNEGGVGAIIGSAIFNILVIVGATCACAGQTLDIWWYPLTRDCVFYLIAIAELAVVLLDEQVYWYEGLVMFLSYVVYCVFMKYNARVAALFSGEIKVDIEDDPEEPEPSGVVPEPQKAAPKPGMVRQSTMQRLEAEAVANGADRSAIARPTASGQKLQKQKTMEALVEKKEAKDAEAKEASESGTSPKNGNAEAEPEKGEEGEEEEEEEVTGWRRYAVDPLNLIWSLVMPDPEHYWLLFTASICSIAMCTYVMVDAVNRCGCDLNIEPLVMGLIFLAAGTSVPDALGSIAVAKQGEGDMAVANALGSNVFDIMLGLGVPWLLKDGVLGREVVFPGAAADLLEWILILVGVLFLLIGSLICNKWVLNKKMGAVLMFFYVVHVTVALIRAFIT